MASARQAFIELLHHGAITPKHAEEAERLAEITPNAYHWQQFIKAVLLWVSCISLSCAVIFFFAYNWSSMGRMLKFALLEIALITSTLVYLKVNTNKLFGDVMLVLSCLLVGALMALFGQTYQTGADPWQLFFNWALVITPWAIIARLPMIWLLWLALINLFLVLYCDVHHNPLSVLFNTKVSELWLVFSVNLISFVVWQSCSQSRPWMQYNWVKRILAVVVGLSITSLATEAIFELSAIDILALVIWFISLMSLYYCYRVKQIDLFMLAGGCLSFILVITTGIVNQFGAIDEVYIYMALAIIVLGLGIAAAIWLKTLQKELVDAR